MVHLGKVRSIAPLFQWDSSAYSRLLAPSAGPELPRAPPIQRISVCNANLFTITILFFKALSINIKENKSVII